MNCDKTQDCHDVYFEVDLNIEGSKNCIMLKKQMTSKFFAAPQLLCEKQTKQAKDKENTTGPRLTSRTPLTTQPPVTTRR